VSTPDLDPAAIMAEHDGEHDCNGRWLWGFALPCLPYRLAAALAYATGERDAEVYRLAAENAALLAQLDETADQRDEQTALADRYWQETDEALRARNAMRKAAERWWGRVKVLRADRAALTARLEATEARERRVRGLTRETFDWLTDHGFLIPGALDDLVRVAGALDGEGNQRPEVCRHGKVHCACLPNYGEGNQ
jgi:hypothetical protein